MPNRNFRKRVKNALEDENLQAALDRALTAWANSRAQAFEGIDFEESRTRLRACKEDALVRIPELFEQFRREAETVGVQVYEAATPEDANRLVLEIAQSHGVRKIVKSKSMVTEEIRLNPRLIAAGIQVTETDLGEWICQLSGERPSNVTMPAMHKTREQVAALFSKTLGEEIPADIPTLVNVARKQMRQAFIEADMGISGANILIADTGTMVIVSNEGNARLVTSLPDVHVAVVSYEKLVPSMDEAAAILKLLSKSGTAQKMTSYVSFITGPSRTSDIEKTLTVGCHGPREVHVIFVDNGRLALLADPEFREALYCIKCGACTSVCPVYRSVGGHVFGHMYFGGIGAVLEAFLNGLDESADIADICATCGRCMSYCPSKIDVPKMVLALRKKLAEAHGQPLIQRLILQGVLASPKRFNAAVNFLRAAQPVWSPLKNLPIPALAGLKHAPALADKPLQDRIPAITEAKGTKRGTVAFYPGCVIENIYPEIGEAAIGTLARLGWEVRLPREQGCCGIPALMKGDAETAEKLARHNAEIADFQSADYIVTACPTCLTALKQQFGSAGPESPESARDAEETRPPHPCPLPPGERESIGQGLTSQAQGGQIPASLWEAASVPTVDRVYDFSEFLTDISHVTAEDLGLPSLTTHDLRLTTEKGADGALPSRLGTVGSARPAPPTTHDSPLTTPPSVTYHDPCHARHGHGIIDEPRELLRLAGYELVEMENPDMCCGFAGSYSLSYPDVSGAIGKRKIASILATGAAVVVTGCPGCLMQLRAGLKEAGSNVKAIHIAEALRNRE